MDHEWDWHRIKYEVQRRGMTLTKLAELNGLDPSACRVAASRSHRKGEEAIATFLGLPVETLFPKRYPVRASRILSSKYESAGASQKSPKAAGMRTAA